MVLRPRPGVVRVGRTEVVPLEVVLAGGVVRAGVLAGVVLARAVRV